MFGLETGLLKSNPGVCRVEFLFDDLCDLFSLSLNNRLELQINDVDCISDTKTKLSYFKTGFCTSVKLSSLHVFHLG